MPTLVPGPPRFNTLILLLIAPEGTTILTEVGENMAGAPALVLPNITSVALEKLVPVIVTIVPAGPESGVNEETVGGLITVKLSVLVQKY